MCGIATGSGKAGIVGFSTKIVLWEGQCMLWSHAGGSCGSFCFDRCVMRVRPRLRDTIEQCMSFGSPIQSSSDSAIAGLDTKSRTTPHTRTDPGQKSPCLCRFRLLPPVQKHSLTLEASLQQPRDCRGAFRHPTHHACSITGQQQQILQRALCPQQRPL
jgi:hypothetical protein